MVRIGRGHAWIKESDFEGNVEMLQPSHFEIFSYTLKRIILEDLHHFFLNQSS